MDHNSFLDEQIRKENYKYNRDFISQNKFLGFENVDLEGLDVPPEQKKDSSPYNLVWLKNIDRLINLIPLGTDFKDYELVDVGCGSGISTLYFASKYFFKSYYGFDFSNKLIAIALKNRVKFFDRYKLSLDIRFHVQDANEFKLSQKSVLFMFNPFGRETIKKMVFNNLNFLKDSNSIILYANDHYSDFLNKYGNQINRDAEYNLSYIKF